MLDSKDKLIGEQEILLLPLKIKVNVAHAGHSPQLLHMNLIKFKTDINQKILL
jgi:hypothetical protein